MAKLCKNTVPSKFSCLSGKGLNKQALHLRLHVSRCSLQLADAVPLNHYIAARSASVERFDYNYIVIELRTIFLPTNSILVLTITIYTILKYSQTATSRVVALKKKHDERQV